MTLRVVTPSGGQRQITISYAVGGAGCWPQTDLVRAGEILDVPPGSALETALGANITTLSDGPLNSALTGSGGITNTANA
jgi:hypothetical protein